MRFQSALEDNPIFASLFQLLDKGDARILRLCRDLLKDAGLRPAFVDSLPFSLRGILLAALILILALTVPGLTVHALRRLRRIEKNFSGQAIPTSYGIALLVFFDLAAMGSVLLYPWRIELWLPWMAAVNGFGALGLLDDLLGDRKIKGLRGHLLALLTQRRITTGLMKAAGGVAMAILLANSLPDHDAVDLVRVAALIALGANAFNLLDLRPGRACGVFCACSTVLLCSLWTMAGAISTSPLLILLIAGLIVWQRDAAARAMLGDTGSNLLGASVGLGTALYAPDSVQWSIVVMLIVLHWVAERTSLTRLIESNSLLRTLDSLTGVRSKHAEQKQMNNYAKKDRGEEKR